MLAEHKLEYWISIVLLIGIILAIIFVCIGGAFYLWQHGNQSLESELAVFSIYQPTTVSVWQLATSLTPLGIIELGLIILVGTQVLRVALLMFFYLRLRDYWFTGISLFVLLILLYSLIWHE